MLTRKSATAPVTAALMPQIIRLDYVAAVAGARNVRNVA